MDPTTAPLPAASSIDDLFTLTLTDGLPVQVGDQTIRYRVVRLRETTVGDERAAQRLAERVVMVNGQHRLLVSDSEFRYALTMKHIAAFECDGQKIPEALIDLDTLGKLKPHDLSLIEQRVFIIELAAELRAGNLTQAEFDSITSGGKVAAQSPQRAGQAAELGPADPESQPGPALLADFVRDGADRAPAGHGH